MTKAPEDAIDYLTVSDPVIHADGMNKYTSYRVDCRPPSTYGIPDNNSAAATTDPFLQNNQEYSSVLRRYSDFLWLYERLHKERAGAIVPHLPEKQAVGKFSPEFVEERRKGEFNVL
jgi:sorting nexin-1/2